MTCYLGISPLSRSCRETDYPKISRTYAASWYQFFCVSHGEHFRKKRIKSTYLQTLDWPTCTAESSESSIRSFHRRLARFLNRFPVPSLLLYRRNLTILAPTISYATQSAHSATVCEFHILRFAWLKSTRIWNCCL